MAVTHRRQFLTQGLATASLIAAATVRPATAASAANGVHVATNTYPWDTFAKRNGSKLQSNSNELLADIAAAGLQGYEPIIHAARDFVGLTERLTTHHLEMRSIYVNSALHDQATSQKSIDDVLEIAEHAVTFGTKIIVTNPSPIRWGGPEDKSDAQLAHQARALNRLGEQLRQRGLSLAYHNHDAELRQGAREFHHMLSATDPQNVKFCLDAHWIYRGCGNSQIAVFDTCERYQSRIVELHLRQSQAGVWTETFALEGDIDYRQLLSSLNVNGILPHLVLEQAIEPKSVVTMSAPDAHRQSLSQLQQYLQGQ